MAKATKPPPKRINAVDVRVGHNVRARRLLNGVTQEQLGDKLGITFQQIQKYEKGTNRISASRLQQIADVLGVTPQFFFAGNGNDKAGKSKGDGGTADEVLGLLTTRDAVRVLKAMQSIDGQARTALVALVEAIAAIAPLQD